MRDTNDTLEDLLALAERNRRQAHDEARRQVALNPDSREAAAALRNVVARFPPETNATLGDPFAESVSEVRRAATLLQRGKAEEAEILLRERLAKAPRDTAAMRLMAQIATISGFPDNARKILGRTIEYDPDSAENWTAIGSHLWKQAISADRIELVPDALRALDRALTLKPLHLQALAVKSAILMKRRELDDALKAYQDWVELDPRSIMAWTNYAYLLKTIGDIGGATAAYRMAVAIDPAKMQAWSGLANLKLAHFFPEDIEILQGLVDHEDVATRIEAHFALAKAFDQNRLFDEAADHFVRGNALRLEQHPHDMTKAAGQVDRATATYTAEFFAARQEGGSASPAPIFILGMHRAGSTLVEQILASHSMIEGTEELFIVQQIAGELCGGKDIDALESMMPDLALDRLTALGDRYIDLSRHHRKTDKPHFTDKNPGNWQQIGFIRSILPNAKIIDARRNPLDCCFANYAHHYNWGVNFAYGMEEIAATYRDYVRLMRHMDHVAPGAVHRVLNDELVENFEIEVRKLLDYLELPFEEQCLRYYETDRAILTPSSAQVREPVNKKGFGRWKSYERWIGPLRDALGDAMDDWRG